MEERAVRVFFQVWACVRLHSGHCAPTALVRSYCEHEHLVTQMHSEERVISRTAPWLF